MYVTGNPIRYDDPTGHMRPTEESENYNYNEEYNTPYPGPSEWYEAGKAYQSYLDNKNHGIDSRETFEMYRDRARMATPQSLWTEDNWASLYEGAATVGVTMISTLSGGPEPGVGGIPESLRRDVLGDPDCAGCGYKRPGTASSSTPNLVNGMTMSTDDALDAAVEFLGEGYKYMGNDRYVSADGLRQVHMKDADILGRHGGGPHMNFETLAPNPDKPGKMTIIENLHIYLE